MIEIRTCEGFDEMEACVQLQIETWGYDESDVIPRKTFLLAQKIGGQVIGAFDTETRDRPARRAGRIAGRFRHVFAGGQDRLENGPQPYLHSHMLAVRDRTAIAASARNSNWSNGVRRFRAASGTWSGPSIRWKSRTLSSISTGWARSSRAYRVDFYGVSSSRLQGGLPTDRFWRSGTGFPTSRSNSCSAPGSRSSH